MKLPFVDMLHFRSKIQNSLEQELSKLYRPCQSVLEIVFWLACSSQIHRFDCLLV